MKQSLPGRVALLSSLAGSFCILLAAVIFLAVQKIAVERQVMREGMLYAEKFTTWTLGYFYQQDNLLHLETQQRFLNSSSNIVYSYIVKGTGEIDVGIEGINSPDVGKSRQPWEPDLELSFEKQVTKVFEASQPLADKFPQRLRAGTNVTLVGFPISCPERVDPCAQLRVALIPESASSILTRLSVSALLFGVLSALLTGACVYYISRREIMPLRKLAMLMRSSRHGGDRGTRDKLQVEAVATEVEEIRLLRGNLIAFLDANEKAAANAAIARMTQALAHDVRRPFSMFKMIIDMIDGTTDAHAAQQLLRQSLPEVHRAMASVSGMISDVMEVGSDNVPHREPANPESLIDATLNELFRVHADAMVTIDYDFQHTSKVNVDTLKVARVFSNIVGNALQAMRYRGKIWFKTRQEENGDLIEFRLGNAGSYIPTEVMPKLFEAFFTSDKKGGTGLGLAIAEKIVKAHGGRIWCESIKDESAPDGQVEFIFNLPIDASKSDADREILPRSSQEITKALAQLRSLASENSIMPDQHDLVLERDLIQALASRGDLPELLIVDDEAVYRNALVNLVSHPVELASHLKVRVAKNSAEAVAAVASRPLLVILDVDLGKESQSGLETVSAMRSGGFAGRVCIHSNRFLVDDYKTAIAAGADAVLPKPMARSQFLKIILEALNQRSS